jgi:hypothetical protein
LALRKRSNASRISAGVQGFEDLGFEDLGFEDLGFEDLGFEDLRLEDLSFENSRFNDLGFEDLGCFAGRFGDDFVLSFLSGFVLTCLAVFVDGDGTRALLARCARMILAMISGILTRYDPRQRF